MKNFKKLISLLAAVAVFFSFSNLASLTVKAEEAATYYVKYVANDNSWRYQKGSSTWDSNKEHKDLYYMTQDIKDGDTVIVEGSKENTTLNFPVHLNNVTFMPGTHVVFYAASINECYVLHDSVVPVNGDVTNGYVYDNAVCNFNNNVSNLQIIDDEGLHATVGVAGTVGHLTGKDMFVTYYDYYSFPAGKLVIKNGRVETEAKYYSTTAPETVQSETPAAQDNSQAAAASSDEYDEVPKTGDSNVIFLLLGISALCLLGKSYLKRV